MGRYRRGHKHRTRGQNRKQNGGDGDYSSSPFSDADFMLVENYLLEYRSRAYELCQQVNQPKCQQHDDNGCEQLNAAPVSIGRHKFLPLTRELCKGPYVHLPGTLDGKERRKVHSLCASLDMYHDSVGGVSEDGVKQRTVIISIYADGLDLHPDLGSDDVAQPFPSRTCRPWYNRARGKCDSDPGETGGRIEGIEAEKEKIRQFVNLPEKSLRTSDKEGQSSCDSLDLGALDSLDLSMVPSVEQTPWMLVDSVDKLKLCVDELVYGVDSKERDGGARRIKIHELAFDLEMHNAGVGSGRSPDHNCGTRTCLVQVTSDVATTVTDEQSGSPVEVYKDFIIDPLAPGVWDAIPFYLGPLFADPNIVKIGHGIGGMDTTSLHRDFGILVVNAFDTYEASTILSLGKGGLGLAPLCRHYGLRNWEHYKRLKSVYQCSDWKQRPLDDGAQEYGRYDIRYLVTLRKLLVRDLAQLDIIGSGFLRFGSGKDESKFDSASTHKGGGGTTGESSRSQQVDSSLDSTVNNAASSLSENEVNNNDRSTSSVDQLKAENNSEDVFVDSAKAPVTSLSKSVICASEFPCYHHLMKAISTSQKRCLKLWTGDADEPILRNPSLLSMIKQAANQKGPGKHWYDANMKLYKQLAEWRADTARREFNSVTEVCSLDFLVHVAYKLSANRAEMRRYTYFLPPLLEDKTLPYYDELCRLVKSSEAFQSRQTRMMDIVFYKNAKVSSSEPQKRQNQVFKLLVASAAVAGIAFAISRVRKR